MRGGGTTATSSASGGVASCDPASLRADVASSAGLKEVGAGPRVRCAAAPSQSRRRSPSPSSGLGLAIGVNTSVFSLINAALFQSGGIDDPASAVRVMRGYKDGMRTSWVYAEYAQLRDVSSDVRLEAWLPERSSLSATPGSTESASVQFVTGGYLRR